MGLGPDSVIILHMGVSIRAPTRVIAIDSLMIYVQGVYGDKPTTIARFKENYTKMLTDEMKARLVLENDEVSFRSALFIPLLNHSIKSLFTVDAY